MRVKRLLWAFATVIVTVLVIGLVFGFNDLKIGQDDAEPPFNEAEEPADLVEDEPEEEPEPEVVSITLSAAGDVTLGNTQLQGYEGTFVEMYDNEGPAYFLSGVLPVFSEDDMTLVNFEGVLTEATEKMEKEFNLKGSPEYMQILNEGSVECVAFSNNHYMDYFEEGFNDTIDGFNNYGITYASDDVVAIYEVKGIKMGVIAVNTSHGESVKDTVEAGLSKLTEAGANVKIVYIHWGVELDHYPQSKHVDLGHDFVDMGADLVLGAHPHVPQGIEIYNGKVICYSLGNF